MYLTENYVLRRAEIKGVISPALAELIIRFINRLRRANRPSHFAHLMIILLINHFSVILCGRTISSYLFMHGGV